MKINIEHLARVEGEGSVRVEIKNGEVKDLKLNIWEPPRFFEGFLVGRRLDEVPDIVARICGICPVSHMTTAIRALEKASGFAAPEETEKIRKIMALSQMLSSHLVHLYMLVLPDFRRASSAVGMLPEFKPLLERFLRMKEAANSVTALFGGRAQHPVAMVIGGFTKPPSRDETGRVIKGLDSIKADALETLLMVSGLKYPEFENEGQYAALSDGNSYAVNRGEIVSNLGLRAKEDDYGLHFEESEVPYSNAKRTVLKGSSENPLPLVVGAISRLNVNFGALHAEAKEAAGRAGLIPPFKNPFMNNFAQAVEIVHAVWEMTELLDGLSGGICLYEVKAKEGFGAAVTEAPRGLLYHRYETDGRGNIRKADIVTPTAHNFLAIETSLRRLAQENASMPKAGLSLLLEMLVRASDPCFSCSVH